MKKEITIFVLGDFHPHKNLVKRLDQYDAKDSSNDWIASQIVKSDLCIVNLESPITAHNKTISKTGPALQGDKSGLFFLKKLGCNLVTLANNHIMDYGNKGLEDTLESLKETNIDFTGAGLTKKDSNEIKYFSKNGVKLAILNFAENEWSTAIADEQAGASTLDEISNFYDIQEAKRNADRVIVITHGGHEMYNLPSPRMKKMFRFFIDAGADAVINHHTHCISGYETYKSKPIFYSLGNFIFENSNKKDSIWNVGMGVSLSFSEEEIRSEITYFKQCNDNHLLIQNLNKDETVDISNKIKQWNELIKCDQLLQMEFNKWVVSVKKQYNSYLEPINFKVLSSLQYRGVFPSFWSNIKRRYLLNLIRCEAHKDVLISILEDENSNS